MEIFVFFASWMLQTKFKRQRKEKETNYIKVSHYGRDGYLMFDA